MTEVYDLIIIGGGPTGINAAVEAAKSNLSYVILEKGMIANSIFHFPANMTFFSTSKNLEIANIPFISHSDKPTRREALEYYRRIADNYSLNIRYYEEVSKLHKNEELFHVTSSKSTYQTKNVLVATGFYDKPRLLNIPGENLDKVKHYYDEAHPYVGQKILVVGAANSACDVALETWMKGAQVTMVIRGATLYPKVKYWILPNIKNRIEEGSIPAYFNAQVTHINPDSVTIQTTEGSIEIENDFVLAMTGYKPDYELLSRLQVPIERDGNQKPIFNEGTLETTEPGIYVSGVINAGMQTSKLFIENTRHHAALVINHIKSKEISPS